MVSIIYPSGNWATGILILFKQEVLRHTSQKKWICLSPTGHVSERLWHISYFIEPLPSSKEWIAWCSNNKANEREMVDLSNVSNSASNSNREAGLVRSDNFCKTRIRATVGRTPFPTNISSHCFVEMSYLSYLITIQKYEQFPNIHSSKKHVHVFQNSRTCFRKKTYVFFSPHILIFSYFAKRLSLNRLR